jgi:hypothetical protein
MGKQIKLRAVEKGQGAQNLRKIMFADQGLVNLQVATVERRLVGLQDR